MNYNVLDESRHALDSLEENAFVNHKDKYVETKAFVENKKDEIDYQELKMNENTDDQTYQKAQEELTKIIDDILEFNDNFNASMVEVDDTNPILDPTDQFTLEPSAIDEFLNNIEE